MNKKITTIIQSLIIMLMLLLATTAGAQTTDEQYRQTIQSADNYFKQSDYLNAKASYQVASQLKPNEQYPKDRMQESISRLRVQMEQMAAYNDKLDYADRLYRDKSYANAITAYQEALRMMPAQEYPSDQIKLIQEIQLEEAQNLARYQKLISDGDALFNAQDYSGARSKYEDASHIYEYRTEAKDKMKASDDRLAEIASQQSGYEKAISEAEMYHARKDYEKELISYQTAIELQPEEPLPQIKIRELNDFLRKYEGYNKFVTEGDELYITQQFAEAKLKYEKALEILPDEAYPKEIISKINIALSEKTEKDKAAYDEAIAMADELYNQEDYDAAMIAYSDALRFWPDGEHAKARLGSISEIRALQRAQEEAYTNTISLADKLFANKEYKQARDQYRTANEIKPFEQYPKVRMEEIDMLMAELQSKLEQYESIVLGADKLFNAGDYHESRIQYLKAQEILSDRSYPEDQIKMIDEILGLEKATLDEYLAAIARGDEHFIKREWEDAKVDYVTANDLIPEEEYPDDKIAEINEILARLKAEQDTYMLALKTADQLFAEMDYSGALREYEKAAEIFVDEAYPRQKIEEIIRLIANMEELEQSYTEAISLADEALKKDDYDIARAEYQRALTLKPDEVYPAEKVNEIDGILVAEARRLAEISAQYDQAITEADAFLAQEDYASAKEKYGLALSLKSAEIYPQEKIAEIDAIFADQEQQRILDENYAELLADADDLFNNGDYEKASLEYEKAMALKPSEQYPKDKLTEIEGIFAEQARLQGIEESYRLAIQTADKAMNNSDYAAAKAEYQRAAELKPEEEYPTVKIAEIDTIIAEQGRLAEIQSNYDAVIITADAFFSEARYAEAKAAYLEAVSIKTDEKYPGQKIEEIDGILALAAAESDRLAQIEADYLLAINEADAFMNEGDYPGARAKYVAALEFKPEENYPQAKITEIDGLLADKEAQRILDENYAEAIAAADKFFNKDDYTEAKAEYEKALGIKAGEQYPADKVAEIDGIFAEEARLRGIDESYNEAITAADELFENEQYVEAKASYSLAAGIKENETYPGAKIAEIDVILTEIALQQSIDEAYAQAITLADNLLSDNNYTEARAAYREASNIKEDEDYPGQKIEEIDAILAAETAEAERLAKLDADYSKAITDADEAVALSEYEKAKKLYNEALNLMPEESYPQQKISEIDVILADIETQRILDENYAEAIAAADKFFTKYEYTEAKAEYEKALGIKAGEQYPADKVLEIDGIFAEEARLRGIDESYNEAITAADELFENEQYVEAKASYSLAAGIKENETYPGAKIAEIDGILTELALQQSIDENYAAALSSADNYFNNENYEEARASYSQASEIKPEEGYPKERITEIGVILAELARISEMNEQYGIAINTADTYFAGQEYPEAREAYIRAQGIKETETYPADKIVEIDNILANLEEQRLLDEGFANAIALGDNHFSNKEYAEARIEFEKALSFKAADQYAADKISEIEGILNEEARLREIEAAYAAAITTADDHLANKQYDEAKKAYSEALVSKPDDVYAIAKVEEINTLQSEMNRLQDIENSYAEAITTGDQAFSAGIYQAARDAYTMALNIKAGESYPEGKITEIDGILEEQARLEALDGNYNRAIAGGDSLFNRGDYEGSKSFYAEAAQLKQDIPYPMQKIDEADALIAEIERQKAVDESYANAIIEADASLERNSFLDALQAYQRASELKPNEPYPKEKLAEINSRLSELEEERTKAYDAAIVQADSYFEIGNYRSAKASYQNAVDIKPDQQYARDRLDEVTTLNMAELEALKVDYRKYIANADNYFKEKIYDGAIENYRLAAGMLPDEEYPGKMIGRITKIINDNAITDVNRLAQVILNNTEKKFDFSSIPVSVRKENYILIKARNLSDKEFKMLVNFGQDASKTGGVVLQVPQGEAVKDYIIRIGALYKWFSEDNNWLSIYPEGGDIEVALIRISKSD